MNIDLIRSLLPDTSFKSFDDIRYSRVLGANRHINMIGEILIDIINDSKTENELKDRFIKVASYYKETRGNQSRAIYNAINEMTYGFNDIDFNDLDKAKQKIINKIKEYDKNAKKNTAKIIEYSNNLIENMKAIMLFDYSSTLNELILKSNSSIDIYIAESRALDGGRPFVEAALKAGHRTFFFPDSTMLEVLKKCDAAFIGVESYYPDGTVFNTIGSDILAILCKSLNKPLFALTPMIKVDERNAYGFTRLSPMPYDYSIKIATNWEKELVEKIDFNGVKLVEVEPELITAIVTELGVIPPRAMYSIAMNYAKYLKGEPYV
ncbi:MAG: initiation factor 2 [Bacillota bacterium]|jgi:ribose 1,5-bisphosphate isomerase|nr:initiation factor 2 [Bacillota bacterium]NLP21671.1 translation initiation factor eIF-2B [Erysipelotrichaceae bacterium]